MAKRVIRSTLPLEKNKAQLEGKLPEGKVSFSELCENGIIKPGMIVVFKKDNDLLVEVKHIESGSDTFNYDVMLKTGIVVIDENSQISIVTVLCGNRDFTFAGRFARAYYSKTVDKIIKATSMAYFKKDDICDLLDVQDYVFFSNTNKFFVQYIEKQCTTKLFLKDINYIDLEASFAPRKFGSLFSRQGFFLIKICPDNIAFNCCKISDEDKYSFHMPYSLCYSKYSFYIVND